MLQFYANASILNFNSLCRYAVGEVFLLRCFLQETSLAKNTSVSGRNLTEKRDIP